MTADPAAEPCAARDSAGAEPPPESAASWGDAGVRRIAAIDAARGAAVIAMVAYHFCWDLTFFRLADWPLFTDPAWLAARAAILCSFLVLAGISAELAARRGMRWGAWARRLAVLAAAAAAITLVTRLAIPDDTIWFGVLHLLAVASVLGLPFLRLPGVVAMLAALACLVAPHVLAGPWFNRPELDWIGLATVEPRANDFVPVLPWFAAVLYGIVAGRYLIPRDPAGVAWLDWRPRSRPGRALSWAGRHSLAVYLVHQPVLIGLVAGFVALSGLGNWPGELATASERSRFLESCQAGCLPAVVAQEGSDANAEAVCVRYCTCVADGLDAAGLGVGLDPAVLVPEQRATMRRVIGECSVPRPSR